ncbi:MAG TPA: CopG family transcriptional regulator [Blastocatellia bacterium]|nr:CopG family transcriptional regulator [Blastocatellia bacterium]
MKTIELNLPEATASRLEEAANKMGVSAEDLLRMSVEEKLARLDESFRDAVDQVLSKNEELYKRLS